MAISSAVPEALAAFAGVAGEGAGRLRRELFHLDATLSRAGPIGDRAVRERLHDHATRSDRLADRVGDVGRAFAAAGAAIALPGAGGRRVFADDWDLKSVLALPGGRLPTLAELEALGPRARVRWFRRFLALPGVDADPNFRGVLGILEAARDGESDLFGAAFLLADAAVLRAMAAGWLAGRGVPVRVGDRREAAAIAAWRHYWERRGDGGEAESDDRWALAEEASVVYGEALVAQRGLRFPEHHADFFRFTHRFRQAMVDDEEVDFVVATLAGLDGDGIDRLLDDAGDVLDARADRHAGAAAESVDPGWAGPLAPWLIDATGHAAGDLVDAAVDAVPAAITVAGAGALAAVGTVVDETIVRAIGELLVDPSATPPMWLAGLLDEILGVHPLDRRPTAAYYVALLADRGYLDGFGA